MVTKEAVRHATADALANRRISKVKLYLHAQRLAQLVISGPPTDSSKTRSGR